MMSFAVFGDGTDELLQFTKNVLHQQKGVYFSWILPDMDYREDFSTFWDCQSEESIYEIDWDCGSEYSEETGGGHAVLCVGSGMKWYLLMWIRFFCVWWRMWFSSVG